MIRSKEDLRVLADTKIKKYPYRRKYYPFESAYCYGMGRILRQMAFLPRFIPLAVDTDHGPSQRDEPTKLEYATRSSLMLYHSPRLVKIWRKNSSVKVEQYYSPYVFYKKRRFKINPADRNGTMVFPAHSTDRLDSLFDINEFIIALKNLPQKYHPIEVCMFYRDIELNKHLPFIESGIRVYCAGHIYDESFIDNFYTIIQSSQYALSNAMGSHALYTVDFGIPFFILEDKSLKYNNTLNDPNCVEGTWNPYQLYKNLENGKKMFTYTPSDVHEYKITDEQKKFVSSELGLDSFNRFRFTVAVYEACVNYHFSNRQEERFRVFALKRSFFIALKLCLLFIKGIGRIKGYINRVISYFKNYKVNKFKSRFSDELKVFTHLTFNEKLLLNKYAKTLGDRSVCVEIGSYLGASACFISAGLKPQSILYCIDTWGNHAMAYSDADQKDENLIEKDTYSQFRSNVKKYSDKIKELRGWSTEVANELVGKNIFIDYIFIDGDHTYEGVKNDWNAYCRSFRKGTIIVFHDTGWAEGVKKFIQEEVVNYATCIDKLPNMEFYRYN